MVATAMPDMSQADSALCDVDEIQQRIAGITLSTNFDVSGPEPVEFLQTVSRVAHPKAEAGGPSAQDIECLRQAAWKYSRQTAMPVVSGKDLVDVLDRLGYV